MRGESSRYKAGRERFIRNSLRTGHFPAPRVGTGGSSSDHRCDSVGTGKLRLSAGVWIRNEEYPPSPTTTIRAM